MDYIDIDRRRGEKLACDLKVRSGKIERERERANENMWSINNGFYRNKKSLHTPSTTFTANVVN